MYYIIIYTLLYRERTKANKIGIKRTRAKDAADLFARSSPLFCSVCCLHRPHHRQPLTTSPPSHQQPATSNRAAPRRSAILPASPRPLPLRQVVKVGQPYSQGGRSPPAHPLDPLHPAGVPRHIGGHLRRGAGSGQPYQGGGARPCDSKFRDFLHGCIALNINYLFSPSG